MLTCVYIIMNAGPHSIRFICACIYMCVSTHLLMYVYMHLSMDAYVLVHIHISIISIMMETSIEVWDTRASKKSPRYMNVVFSMITAICFRHMSQTFPFTLKNIRDGEELGIAV